MDLSYSDEQQHLRENLSSFFSKESTPERVRAAEPSGFDPELWDKIAAMGLPAMAVPEDLGGGGASVGRAATRIGRRPAPRRARAPLPLDGRGHDLRRIERDPTRDHRRRPPRPTAEPSQVTGPGAAAAVVRG